MKVFFHVLALSGAFFVSSLYAYEEYVRADVDSSVLYEATTAGVTGTEIDGSVIAAATLIAEQISQYQQGDCELYVTNNDNPSRIVVKMDCQMPNPNGTTYPYSKNIFVKTLEPTIAYKCPPGQSQTHIIGPVNKPGEPTDTEPSWCLDPNYSQNPDSCPSLESGQAGAIVFNDGSFPSQICYDVNGEVCRYPVPEQGGTFTHPVGIGTGYDCSTNEPVDSVPDSEQDPDDSDCQSFDAQGQNIYCHEDMDDRCSLQGNDYFCDEGCGFVNNVFMCPKPDSNISDPLDCTDPEYAQVNPEVCSNDPSNPDSNGDGVLDNQDIAQGVSNLTSAQNTTNELLGNMNRDINNNLDGIGTKLDSLKNKQDQANFQLGAIEENTNRTADSVESIEEFITKEPDVREPNYSGSESMWESEYPDGITGIWNEKRGAFMQTGAFQFLQQFTLSGSGGEAPDMQICFNMPPVASFGCKDFGDFSYIWAFIKMCILITAAWLCRSLIFGG